MSRAERVWPTAAQQYHVELISGVEIEKPLPKHLHAIVQAFLVHWLIEALGLEEYWIGSEWNVWCGPDRLVPDIAVALKTSEMKDGDLVTGPALAVEIVSPGQTLGDLIKKSEILMSAGTPRVWIIWPEKQRAWEYSSQGLQELTQFIAGDAKTLLTARLWALLP